MNALIRQGWARWVRRRAADTLPLVLDRRRIYVLPTRFGMAYAVLLLVMLVGALNYNNNPALLLALLLTAVGLASLLVGHLQLSGLQINAISSLPAYAGQPIAVRIHASAATGRSHQGLLLQWANILDSAADAALQTQSADAAALAVLHLQPDSGMAELMLGARERGQWSLPRLKISTIQPLGLARNWSYILVDTKVLVYPAPEIAPPALPLGEGAQAQPRPQRSGEDLHQLRDYRIGDARHTIAWKHSARHGSLLVREHEQPQGDALLLDFAQLHFLPYEARLSRLAAWVAMAERSQRRYSLQLPQQARIGPALGHAHHQACLRALALMPRHME